MTDDFPNRRYLIDTGTAYRAPTPRAERDRPAPVEGRFMTALTADRVAAYAYRFWIGRPEPMTEWPTVRRVARALRVRYRDLEELAGDGPFFLTGYGTEDFTLGDLFIEADTPEVEAALCRYWLPHSRGCYCGKHRGSEWEVAYGRG